MKAEAILRGATPTYNTTALSLVNQLRTTRKAAPMTNLTLDDMLKERARDLSYNMIFCFMNSSSHQLRTQR
jgi:uncharacterized protein YkwD